METPEVGDYIFSSYQIYEIIAINKIGITPVYDIKEVDNPADSLDLFESTPHINIDYLLSTRGLTLQRLLNIGQLVKKEDAKNTIEVLFKKLT